MRKPLSNISVLQIEDYLVDDASIISEHIVDYYSNLFNFDNARRVDLSLVQQVVLASVTSTDNHNLTVVHAGMEIR